MIPLLKFINSSESSVTGHNSLLTIFGLVHKWQLPPFLIPVAENVWVIGQWLADGNTSFSSQEALRLEEIFMNSP